jgi:hypothetical protein
MRIATDRIELIYSWAKQGLLEMYELEIMVFEDHWRQSNLVSRNALEIYVMQNVIQFIETDEMPYSEVFLLKEKFKGGLHPINCVLLEYCRSNDVTLVTSDMALLNASKVLKYATIEPKLFIRQLHFSSKTRVKSSQKINKIEMKISKELGPH